MSEEEAPEPIEEKEEQRQQEPQEGQPKEEVKEQVTSEQEGQDIAPVAIQKEIALNEIVKEKQQMQSEQRRDSVPKKVSPPVLVNPIFYYKGHEKYDWRIQSIDPISCVQKLQVNIIPEVHELPVPNDVAFDIVGTTNVKGHIFYNVRVKDKKGQRQISRRYTQYMLWRSKLVELWPCIIFASLPNKTLMGVSEEDVIRGRSKYITRFLRSIYNHEEVYESDQVQVFLNEGQTRSWQTYFSEIVVPKYPQLVQKYKKHYTEEYVYSQREEFMYKKDQMPVILDEYQVYFSSRKMDLMDYCTSIRRMAESKQNYFRAVNRLNQTLLPDYEDNLYRWIYGESLPQPPPSIMERISMKTKKPTEPENKEGEAKEVEKPHVSEEEVKFGLYSSQPYKSKLDDTALLIHNFNSSTWAIYDVIKYELKEIDSVLGAVEQSKTLQRQMEYFRRTININKEQIQSLNNNKTTLKTFFMDGTSDDKKTKLANDNQILEQQLQKLTELYYIMMVLLEKQLEQYHKTRASFYRRSFTKAIGDQVNLVRSIMDFKIYEEQLFAKERLHRVEILKGQSGVQEQKEEEEVKF